MRGKAREGTDGLERREARAAAAGERGGSMREPSARKGAGRARRHDDGAGAFLPLCLSSALALQVAEAGGPAPRRLRATAPLVLSAVSGVDAARFRGNGHRIAAIVFVAVTTAVAALGPWRIARQTAPSRKEEPDRRIESGGERPRERGKGPAGTSRGALPCDETPSTGQRRPALPRASPAVPSALAGLASGFGMGPGVPRPPEPLTGGRRSAHPGPSACPEGRTARCATDLPPEGAIRR